MNFLLVTAEVTYLLRFKNQWHCSTRKTKHKLKDLRYAEMELTKPIFSFPVHKVFYSVKVWTTVQWHQWKIWGLWVRLTESHLCSSFTTTATCALGNTRLQLTVAIRGVLSHLMYVFFSVSSRIWSFVEYSLGQPTPVKRKLLPVGYTHSAIQFHRHIACNRRN